MSTDAKFPMCERWAAARGDQGIITAFLDALEEKGVVLCKKTDGPFAEYARIIERDIETLYMEYCDVDPKTLEEERRALVKQAQETSRLPTPSPRLPTGAPPLELEEEFTAGEVKNMTRERA